VLPAEPDVLPVGPEGPPARLERLAGAIAELAAQDPAQDGDALLAAEFLAARRLADQLDGVCLRLLAAVDARGAAGAEHGVRALSTAGWLRASLQMSAAAAGRAVRTARALHRGPLGATARALAAGEVSAEHATVLADATHDLPGATVAEAEPLLVDAARRLDPPRLRQLTTHLRTIIDPDQAEARGRARWERRGLWLSGTYDGMVAVDGLLDPEAGETVRSALLPLARPTGPDDDRSGAQRRADALAELARQALQDGRVPQVGGLRPQVTVTVELASLLAGPGGIGGTGGWGGSLPGETVRRWCCDATISRAIVHRHPHHPSHRDHATSNHDHHSRDGAAASSHAMSNGGHATTHAGHAAADGSHVGSAGAVGSSNGSHADRKRRPGAQGRTSPGSSGSADRASPDGSGTGNDGGLAARLHNAIALLPPPLGAPTELLDLGRATRVISPALRRALAVRDGGCVALGCDRPAAWTDAHHLVHWLDGGPTSLDSLVLLCRRHHRAAHEGGWQFHRNPASGRLILSPPARRRAPPAA
jgi:hypothetical protein